MLSQVFIHIKLITFSHPADFYPAFGQQSAPFRMICFSSIICCAISITSSPDAPRHRHLFGGRLISALDASVPAPDRREICANPPTHDLRQFAGRTCAEILSATAPPVNARRAPPSRRLRSSIAMQIAVRQVHSSSNCSAGARRPGMCPARARASRAGAIATASCRHEPLLCVAARRIA